MSKILVLNYSGYGHIETLAKTVDKVRDYVDPIPWLLRWSTKQ